MWNLPRTEMEPLLPILAGGPLSLDHQGSPGNISCVPSETSPPWGTQMSLSWVVLEGFLKEEEKVEDGGLGVGTLRRDFLVGMWPPYLVTWEEHSWVSEDFWIEELWQAAGHALEGQTGRRWPVGTGELLKALWENDLVGAGLWKGKVDRSQEANSILCTFTEP